MPPESSRPLLRATAWFLQRNPIYLLSAVFIAVGARMLLDSPTCDAGDVQHILLTLAALQAYEWGVGGVLLLLHRTRRSPEDMPSLLLVAALFWTGPLIATMEMTAARPALGAALAVACGVIALGELSFVARQLRLAITWAGKLLAGGCLVLTVGVAPLLTVPATASRLDELVLYAAWWALAGIALLGALVIRRHRLRLPEPGTGTSQVCELCFLAITVVGTGGQLVAMNHAFFCHAALFYASPVLIALTIVAWQALPRSAGPLIALFASLPVCAIILATGSFHEDVPIQVVPRFLRDPLLPTLIAAAVAWMVGFGRFRRAAFLHAGLATLGYAAYESVFRLPGGESMADVVVSPRQLWTILLAIAAGYLLVSGWIRKSRLEAILGIASLWVAITLGAWERTGADEFFVAVAAAWCLLLALHVERARPPLIARLLLIGFLAIAPWTDAFAAPTRWWAAGHSIALVLLLVGTGWAWHWTGYRLIGAILAGGYAAIYTERELLAGNAPLPLLLVIAGFLLLSGGAAVSWHKARWLDRMERWASCAGAPDE